MIPLIKVSWLEEKLVLIPLYMVYIPTDLHPQQLQSFHITKVNVSVESAGLVFVYPLYHIQWFLKAYPQTKVSTQGVKKLLGMRMVATFQAGLQRSLRWSESAKLKASMPPALYLATKFCSMYVQMTVRLELEKLPVPCQLRAATGWCRRSSIASKQRTNTTTFIQKYIIQLEITLKLQRKLLLSNNLPEYVQFKSQLSINLHIFAQISLEQATFLKNIENIFEAIKYEKMVKIFFQCPIESYGFFVLKKNHVRQFLKRAHALMADIALAGQSEQGVLRQKQNFFCLPKL